MKIADIHRWSVQLAIAPGRAEMLFIHASRSCGLQILDSVVWPLSPDVRSEYAYLSELYGGVLDFMERRV